MQVLDVSCLDDGYWQLMCVWQIRHSSQKLGLCCAKACLLHSPHLDARMRSHMEIYAGSAARPPPELDKSTGQNEADSRTLGTGRMGDKTLSQGRLYMSPGAASAMQTLQL